MQASESARPEASEIWKRNENLIILSDDPIQCYNCDSLNDTRCLDKFNRTDYSMDVRDCPGCCVKLVEHMYTRKYQYGTFFRSIHSSYWRDVRKRSQIYSKGRKTKQHFYFAMKKEKYHNEIGRE